MLLKKLGENVLSWNTSRSIVGLLLNGGSKWPVERHVTFDGFVEIEGGVSNFVTAQVCDVDKLTNCKTDDIVIQGGESKLLVLTGSFTNDLGTGAEGLIKLKEGSRTTTSSRFSTSTRSLSIQNGEKAFEVGLIVERPPLFDAVINIPFTEISLNIGYNALAERVGVSQLTGLLMLYTFIVGMFFVVILSIRWKKQYLY